MLSGMNTGHAAMSTGHANSCRDMIRRLESMVWMGMDIPMEAIRMQIASALDYLIYMEKIPGGIRRIGQIMSVDELKEGEILLKTVMDRDQEGMIRWYENEIKSW